MMVAGCITPICVLHHTQGIQSTQGTYTLYQQVLNLCQDVNEEVPKYHHDCLQLEGKHLEEVHPIEGHVMRLEGSLEALQESKEVKGCGGRALPVTRGEKETWDGTMQASRQKNG